LLSLGQRDEPGNDDKHKRPTDIAWLPDGTIFVSDGYGNTRVVKFDKNGKYLMTWGTPGTGNSQFNTPHSVTVDKTAACTFPIERTTVFRFSMRTASTWTVPNITQPYHILVNSNGYFWAFSGPLDKFLKYDLNGHLSYAWGTHGTTPGLFWAVHEFSADSDGNLYTAEVFGGRPQKFRPRQGADPAHFYKPVPLMPKKSS
jgi:peptidylamidoglycolate lyase